MNHCRDSAEPSPEPGNHLRRQRDFRHEDDGAFSNRQRLPYRFHEHFRLPAAGYPVQQELPAFPAQAGQNLLQRFLLTGSQFVSGISDFRKSSFRRTECFLLRKADQAVLRQLFQRVSRILYALRQFPHRLCLSGQEQFQELTAFSFSPVLFHGGPGFRFRNSKLCSPYGFYPHTAAPHLGRKHQPERFRHRAVRLLRHFLCQGHQFRRNSRVVFKCPVDSAQSVRRDIALLCHVDNDAFLFTGPERNSNPLSCAQLHAVRNQIGKRLCHILMNDVHDHPAIHPFPSFPGTKNHFLLYLFVPCLTRETIDFPSCSRL